MKNRTKERNSQKGMNKWIKKERKMTIEWKKEKNNAKSQMWEKRYKHVPFLSYRYERLYEDAFLSTTHDSMGENYWR